MCVAQVPSSLFVDIGSLPGQEAVWITSPRDLPGLRLQEHDVMPGSLKRTGAGDHTLTPILASPALYQMGRPPAPALLLRNIPLLQDFSVSNPGSSWAQEDKLATVAAYQMFSSCCRIKSLRILKIRCFCLTQQTESGLLGVSRHFIKVYSR